MHVLLVLTVCCR